MKGSLARAAGLTLGIVVRAAECLIRILATDGRRVYFDSAAYPWTAVLESASQEMRKELDAVLADRASIPNFQDVSEEQRTITRDDRWKVFIFAVFGTAVVQNCRRCPRTAAALQSIPGLRNAMFSILAPHKTIPPHRGPYNGLLRYHLALKVPRAASACAITVGGITCHWQEGLTLIFDDTYVHSVHNDTDEERVVLFADFERPLPLPLAFFNRIVLAAIARTPLARGPLERLRNAEA